MTETIQLLVDLVANFLEVAFPIALVFCLAEKFVNLILSFIFGSKTVRL